MDILQQSLQAADILSGEENDDLFGELGLTFNNTVENAGLPSELAALASQGDALYNNESGIAAQTTFDDFNAAADSASMSGFDTSQFLNTSAPVNVAHSPQLSLSGRQSQDYTTSPQGGYQSVTNELNSTQPASISSATEVQYSPQPDKLATYSTQYQLTSQAFMQSNAAAASHTLCLFPSEVSKTTTTVAQTIAAGSCNSVFSKVPTQTLTTSVQMRSLTPSVEMNQTQSVQNAMTGPIQPSTPMQNIQPSTVVSQQGSRQLITLVQKPNIVVNSPANHAQVINGLTVQPQQNHNLAVLRVAGTKHSLNLSDPQVVKALTANIHQKQQNESVQVSQQPQQQFLKLGQNNALINVVSQRPQQQTLLRGTQQITLQNGQTIILNNGQQVQLCTAQSQSGQLQILQPAALAQNGITPVRNNQQTTSNVLQAARSNQVPIKGIQIASVNIPIVCSSANTTSPNLTSVQSNMFTIPVVAKQDLTQNTVTPIPAVALATTTQTGSVMQTHNSSTVRSLLANAILRHNNVSLNNSNTSQATLQVQPTPVNSDNTNGQVESGTHPQIGATLRLNLTPQQASQLTPAQVQAILKQHRATMQAKAVASAETNATPQTIAGQATATFGQATPDKTIQTNQSQLFRPFTTNSVTSATTQVKKPHSSEQATVQVFRVDPSLTENQIEEVKRLLSNRTIASKLSMLTKEQQQLVLAFQAQIKAMSPPVQQYYLRNPQLFMQKVLQQIRAGKPFLLQIKTDPQQKTTTVTALKSQHPTISLTQDPSRANRTNTPSPTMRNHQAISVVGKPVVLPNMTSTVTVQVPKKAIKRPAPEAPTRLSLVLEQLECHKKMVTYPDCTHPFKSVRDAIRRLVPFHTCNIPNAKQEDFDESELIFDKIANRIAARTRAMVNKYHLLCLRDSTRDACSAEMVMIERMFLQKEKAKFAEDKTKLQEDPSSIEDYFPHQQSGEVIAIESDDEEKPTQRDTEEETPQTRHIDSYFNDQSGLGSSAYDQSAEVDDSPLMDSDTYPLSRSTGSDSDLRFDSEGRFLSRSAGPSDAKRLKNDSMDSSSQDPSDVSLLQEAVDSILM